MKKYFALFLATWVPTSINVGAQVNPVMGGHAMDSKMGAQTLPPSPQNYPAWMKSKKRSHIFYKKGSYNFDIYNVKPLAYDLNAVAVGHAMAYEDELLTRLFGTEDAKEGPRAFAEKRKPQYHGR